MRKNEKVHFSTKENDNKELLLEGQESDINMKECEVTHANNKVLKNRFKIYENDVIKSASCLSKLLFYWAFRIIKVRIKIKI